MAGQKNGVSTLGLQKLLGLGSYETAWAWIHKFRRVKVIPGRNLLSAEVDEVFIGGEKRAEGKAVICVAVEVKLNKLISINLPTMLS